VKESTESKLLEELQELRRQIDLVYIRNDKQDYINASNKINGLIDLVIHKELK
jgi:predicted O-methyltransferase YrrM